MKPKGEYKDFGPEQRSSLIDDQINIFFKWSVINCQSNYEIANSL